MINEKLASRWLEFTLKEGTAMCSPFTGEVMTLEHIQIEMQDNKHAAFEEDFSDMHTHDLLRYSRSKNLQYLEWADMVSLVHELADRLETAYEWAMNPMSKKDMEETLEAISDVLAKEGRSP